jgi:hypothetical protein
MPNIGLLARDGILWIAQLLVRESASGWVALVFLFSLAVLTALFLRRSLSQASAIVDLRREVASHADTRSFSDGFEGFLNTLRDWKKQSPARRALVAAIDEYADTTIDDQQNGIRRNAVRPGTFLNMDDLGFAPGGWRIVSGTFVSLGLLCTFLGLVAALNALGSDLHDGAKPEDVVITLMTIASAKFVMSLAGLFCSIVFSVVQRWSQDRVNQRLHGLCYELERRLSYVSLEDIGFRQLTALQEQRHFYKTMAVELVAELKRPLETMPEKISTSIASSISTEMKPLFEQITRASASGMESIVGDLSNKISSSVGTALERASRSLTEATGQLGGLVTRMNASGDRMGEGMETALRQLASALTDLRSHVQATGETAANTMSQGAERLLGVMNQTLQGIRDNTAAGADAMKQAAAEMRSAAVTFREELAAATRDGVKAATGGIEAAGAAADQALGQVSRNLLATFDKTSLELAEAGTRLSGQMGQGMEEALGKMTAAIDSLRKQAETTGETTSNAMTRGAEQLLGVMNQTLQGIRDNTAAGADAMKQAAAEMRTAAEGFRKELEDATKNGVRVANDSIQAAGSAADSALSKAGETLLASFGKTSAEIAKAGADMGEAVNTQVIGNIRELGNRFGDLVGVVNDSLNGLRSVSTGLKTGADSIALASISFEGASRDLVAAIGPVRNSQQNIEAAIRDLLAASKATAEGSRTISRDMAHVLETARAALGNEREGIRQTMQATGAALTRLGHEADKLDRIDEMLGRALTAYADQLQQALGSAQHYVRDMNEELTRGVDTMRQVVERAEEFIPRTEPVTMRTL